MVKNDGAETRRQRISQIARMIQATLHESKNEEISLSRLIGTVMYQMGLTKEKVMEYVEIIQTMGQCELDVVNDKIRRPQV